MLLLDYIFLNNAITVFNIRDNIIGITGYTEALNVEFCFTLRTIRQRSTSPVQAIASRNLTENYLPVTKTNNTLLLFVNY